MVVQSTIANCTMHMYKTHTYGTSRKYSTKLLIKTLLDVVVAECCIFETSLASFCKRKIIRIHRPSLQSKGL